MNCGAALRPNIELELPNYHYDAQVLDFRYYFSDLYGLAKNFRASGNPKRGPYGVERKD